MFSNDRNTLRQQFFQAWQKYRTPAVQLTPLEQMIGELITAHPEYQHLFDATQADFIAEDFAADGINPFLHLGLHIALKEQLQADRPAGISALMTEALRHGADWHALEHRLMDCLQSALWQAQAQGTAPDELQYLDCVRRELAR